LNQSLPSHPISPRSILISDTYEIKFTYIPNEISWKSEL
jgi:hypothetical protein